MSALAAFESRHPMVVRALLLMLATLAVLKLGGEMHRLTLATDPTGAIDLGLRHDEVHRWFAGQPVYSAFHRLSYPPQAFAMLWPAVGWLSFPAARWLWAVTTVVLLAWTCVVLVRASGARSRLERAVIVIAWLSINAVGSTIGNGQLTIHILLSLIVAFVLLWRPAARWPTDLVVALLLQVALMKPTIALPFACVALLVRPRIRPLVFTVVLYVALTLLAARYQPEPLGTLARQWLALGASVRGGGYGDVQTMFGALGWQRAAAIAPAFILLAFAAFVRRWRRADPWVLLGMAAMVARLWTYHRHYDDALTIVPLLALFRLATDEMIDVAVGRRALLSFGIAVLVMAVPARFEWAAPPINWIYIGGHAAVWLVLLLFLAYVAMRDAARGDHLAPRDVLLDR